MLNGSLLQKLTASFPDACLYCAADLLKDPQVDLYGNPCCANCFDNAAFLKDPTIARVPALLSAEKQPSREDFEKKTKEERRNMIMPSAAKMGPAVNELRKRLEVGDDDKPAARPTLSPAISVATSVNRPPVVPKVEAKRSSVAHIKAIAERGNSSVLNAGLRPETGPPRVPITSPRIAASKAFFDGSASGSPASPPLPAGLAWNRPSPKPLQTPAWQRHRPSQSMPVIPKSTMNTISEPAWLRSPILRGKADASQVPKAITSPKESGASIILARPRAARPLPLTPATTTSAVNQIKSMSSDPVKALPPQHQTCSRTTSVETEKRQNPQELPSTSPKKISAGILKRSQSFRKTETGHAGVEESARLRQGEGQFTESEGSEQLRRTLEPPHVVFKKSTSASSLIEASSTARRPQPPRSQTGLERSTATIKGSSPTAAKRISRQAPSAVDTTGKKDSQAGAATAARVSANAKCSGCSLRLFGMSAVEPEGNRIITLPGSDLLFHAKCFVCDQCKKTFNDGVFVQLEGGERVHEQVRRLCKL